MRHLFIIFAFLVATVAGCKKDSKDSKGDCTTVTITQNGTLCSLWAIKIGSNIYPSGNIPDEFKHEGATVYACYLLYDDVRACACCGGTWANIQSMRTLVR